MADLVTGSVGRQIESLFDGSSVAGLTDRQLLERFTTGRDARAEVAFGALVARHGPMVLGICREILGDRHHAEDAFQAVFLVLACKARSIRNPDLVGAWLYGVALRTAHKVKTRLSRQHQNEESDALSGQGVVTVVEPTVPAGDLAAMACEQAEILHDEIARLPGSFRLPVVLCYFEGLTLDEAARRLQCPPGTVRSRLARARDKLRRGLTRRGVVLPATALAASLESQSASAFVSPALCDITTRAAIQFAAGQAASPLAASLAHEVLRSMFANKLRLVATTLLLIGVGATGAGYLTLSIASQDEPKPRPVARQPQVAASLDDTNQRPAPGRMFVVGRVLDPKGKPVPNATTMVYAAIKQPGSDQYAKMTPSAIGQARSDGSGRFQIDAPRTESSRHYDIGAVALAPGYGAGWVELDPDADRPDVDITLRPEQVIQGRFFDVNGRPAQGVTVTVQRMGRLVPANLATHRLESIDGPSFWWNTSGSLPAWPMPAVSDADGQFTIRGAGRNLRVILTIDDPRFARQQVSIDTDRSPDSKRVTMALEPARIIQGRITDAGTGKPIPHAPVVIMSVKGSGATENGFEADAEGRFRANPLSADRYYVSASAPVGKPYLRLSKHFDWPKGAVEHSIDLALPRGVEIHGKVVEEGSGRPVAGARISFPARRIDPSGVWNGRAATEADGSFRLAGLPGPGYLVVLGPSDDYVLREENSDRLIPEGGSTAGGRRFYAHAFIPCDPKPADKSLEVNVALRRGVTVSGQVVGPEGRPLQDAWMISRIFLGPAAGSWLFWSARHHGSVSSGRFKIHGLDPDAEIPVYFLDPHHKLGTTVNLSGKSAGREPLTVQLQPCGAAKARLVDATGKPIAGYRASGLIHMVVSPGQFRAADAATIYGIDPINYADGPVSDAQGRVVFPALVPGASYRRNEIYVTETRPGTEFTVKPGETLDLGDIVIKKPQP